MTEAELPPTIHGHPKHYVNWLMNLGSAKSVDEAVVILRLLAAIGDRDASTVAELMAAGLDPNMKLPNIPMLEMAVNSGVPEIVQSLLDAGADPDTPGALSTAVMYQQTESARALLKAGAKIKPDHFAVACGGGDSGLVKALLEAGADVNGVRSISPTNTYQIKNCTALMMAAESANPAIVKLLLAAGADVKRVDSRGSTALDWARLKSSKKALQVAEILEKAGAPAGAGGDTSAVAPDFSKAAKSEGFLSAIARVQAITGKKPVKIELEEGPLKGGKAFVVTEEAARKTAEQLRDECLKLGCTIFVSRDITPRNGWCIGLLPTADVFQAITAICTADAGKWLKELHKKQPLIVTDIGVDFVRGRFTTVIPDPDDLAKRMYEFCADIVDQGCETVEALAGELRKSPGFYFWWD